MTVAEDLGVRQSAVLAALVQEYISTGEPVGSRTISKKYQLGVSPATIRNTMSDLEDMGLLQQPHTSAGRAPTDQGIRIFIDYLMEIRSLSDPERFRIEQRYGDIALGNDLLSQVVRVLSELTQHPAVVRSPRADGLVMKQLRFMPVEPGRVLAVLVTSFGVTQSRLLEVTIDLNETRLERIHNYLNELIPGRTLSEAKQAILREKQESRRTMDQMMADALTLGRGALDELDEEPDLRVHGQAKLLQRTAQLDVEKLRHLMELLDDQAQLAELLDATMNAPGPLVMIGGEHPVTESAECSVIAATYSISGDSRGTLAVVGPRSMDYTKVVPVVGFTAHILSGPDQD